MSDTIDAKDFGTVITCPGAEEVVDAVCAGVDGAQCYQDVTYYSQQASVYLAETPHAQAIIPQRCVGH